MSAMRNLRKFQLREEGGFLHVCNAESAEVFNYGKREGFLHACNAKFAEISTAERGRVYACLQCGTCGNINYGKRRVFACLQCGTCGNFNYRKS
eukprot:COSAG02_NODE_1424_length_12684_cov_13.471116_15_plen_94_part_00